MADSDIAITAGVGTKIDTRTVGAGTDEHRQVIVIGDPSTAANVAAVDATFGLAVDVTRLPIQDSEHNDGESATEDHINAGAKIMALNNAGTFDLIRANVSVNKNATYASAQTGTALWTPAAGKAIVVTSVQIQSYGTTAGTAQLWFGASGDTTFTRGTDAAVFDGEFAPSVYTKPGVIMTFPTPIRATADYLLRVTTTNAQSVTFNVWGYEI